MVRDYIIRRLLLSLLSVWLVSIVVFAAIRLSPGDIVTQLLEGTGFDPAKEAQLRESLGLNGSLPEQYVRWAGRLVRGDLGHSLFSGEEVGALIRQRLPVTIELAILTLTVSAAVGIPLGIIAAIRQDRAVDYVLRSLGIIVISVPYFWFALMVIVIPGRLWGWTPPVRYTPFFDDPIKNLSVFGIPALILGMRSAGVLMRYTRSGVLEILRLDFVRTARAKGLQERVVILRHVLRNAMIPTLTVIGLEAAFLFSGTVIIEQVFGLPGIGRLIIDSLSTRDYVTIQSAAFLLAVGIVFVNLLVDLSYTLVDPRIRVSG